MDIVDGGTVTKVECVDDPKAPAKKAYYIAVNKSKRRPNLMEDICRDIQMLIVSDVLREQESGKKSLESLRVKSATLAADISAYTQALFLLEDARQKETK